MPSTRYKGYALIDCNNFFVSCERVFKPHLNHKPVVVLSTNDGCIISRSAEVKSLGVPMGAPLFMYQELLSKHQSAIFSSNFELYGDFSDRVMQVISLYDPHLEIYSIDEAFVPIIDQSEEHFINLRERILKWTGIPVSIGLGPTKTLAKAANYYAKKIKTPLFNLIDPLIRDPILKKIEVSEVWGIGRQFSKKLNALRVYNAFQFKESPEYWIRQHFHLPGLRVAMELKGLACHATSEEESTRKSTMYSKSFSRPVEEFAELLEAVSHYATRAAYKMRKNNYLASTFSLYLKQAKTSWIKTLTLPYPSDCTLVYLKAAKELLKQGFKKGAYLKAGIYLSGLSSKKKARQLHLFAPHEVHKEQLMRTLDEVQKRYGYNHLFFGAEGFQRTWKTKGEYRSPLYTTSWKDLLTISI